MSRAFFLSSICVMFNAEENNGAPTGTRTPIDRLGGDCSILLSYESVGSAKGDKS